MRLPVDGIYEDRPALASLIIEHKGERPCQGSHRDVRLIQHCVSGVSVNVGSGFTNSQRIEFAKDPSLIVSSLTMLELQHPIDRPSIPDWQAGHGRILWRVNERC
jgi:hypothetical protein